MPHSFLIQKQLDSRAGNHHSPYGVPPWIHHIMGAGPKPARGEVRYLILHAIADYPRYGYQVICHIQEQSSGAYRPSAGTVYPGLQLLVKRGYASVSLQKGRKLYAITQKGKTELSVHEEEIEEIYQRLSQDNRLARQTDFEGVWQRIGRMLRAIRIAVRKGELGPNKWRTIQRVIDNAMTEIEYVLRSNGNETKK